MLTIPPAQFRKRRKPPKRTAPPAPPLPANPVIVAVAYQQSTWAEITFDRAVNISGMLLTAVAILDGPNGHRFVPTGPPTQTGGPATVKMNLLQITTVTGPTVILQVSALNGIVAASDG